MKQSGSDTNRGLKLNKVTIEKDKEFQEARTEINKSIKTSSSETSRNFDSLASQNQTTCDGFPQKHYGRKDESDVLEKQPQNLQTKEFRPRMAVLLGVLTSAGMTIFSILYFFLGIMAANDMHGREAYFDEAPEEINLIQAFSLHSIHPNWTLRTEDWGYIQRAHLFPQKIYQGFEVYSLLMSITIICSILWFLSSLNLLREFISQNPRIPLSSFIASSLGFVLFFFGYGNILYRISSFFSEEIWDNCTSKTFIINYHRSNSVLLFSFSLGVIVAGVQTITNCFMYFSNIFSSS